MEVKLLSAETRESSDVTRVNRIRCRILMTIGVPGPVYTITYYSGHESFFFFSSRRRHTRFDCDWSSDVCSSDLANPERLAKGDAIRFHADVRGAIAAGDAAAALNGIAADISGAADFILSRGGLARSEERRGGEECRSRWAPDHLKKKRK